MLNSDKDLDISPNSRVAKSTSLQSSPLPELSIEQSPAMPIFTEATAQAVRLTDAPVAILTTIAGSGYQIGSISGLEQFIELPHQPNLHILAGLEYFHDRTICTHSFSVTNCHQHPQLAQSSLCRVHGIQAYLGVPIITAANDRLGTLSILDFKPRQFSDRDIDLLQLVSRLVASEFERKSLSQAQLNRSIGDLRYQASKFDDPVAASEHISPQIQPPQRDSKSRVAMDISTLSNNPHEQIIPSIHPSAYPQLQSEIQFKLLTHLAQELRTPLTSVLGMASVLQQEIYGPLSSKQKDYLGIIHHSSRQLVTIVEEISQLGGFDFQQHQLTLKSVDLEMLCQLAIQSLEALAQKKQQQIVLNLCGEPSLTSRIWLLDKDKVRQIVYYLCLSLIHASALDSQISIALTNLTDGLQIQIATNDPQVILKQERVENTAPPLPSSKRHKTAIANGFQQPSSPTTEPHLGQLRVSLGLSLSHSLAKSHGGKIEIVTNNRGYQLTLPLIIADRGAIA